MNELIKVNYDNDRPTVSARELHEFLEVGSEYSHWFKRMCEYGFIEGTDFSPFLTESSGGRPAQDAQLTIEMAKEICMLQRNEKGKQARQYFIQLEKDWNSPEKIMARALQIAHNEIKKLSAINSSLSVENAKQRQLIGELKTSADYTDVILKNKGLVSINQIAKDYGMSARKLNKLLHEYGVQYKQSGQWLLYEKYHACGYTHSETVQIEHSDGKLDIKMHTKWTQKGRLFLYNLLKQQNILPVIEIDSPKIA